MNTMTATVAFRTTTARYAMPMMGVLRCIGWGVAFCVGAGSSTALAANAAPTPTTPTTPTTLTAPTPISATQPHLTVSADGQFVIDIRARLAWSRCVEGMSWNGSTCSGVPHLLTHTQAQSLAIKRWKAHNVAWRLPRVTELKRVVDKTTDPPALNPTLFPRAPVGWHWSATANVNTSTVNPYNYGTVMRGGQGEGSVSLVQGWAVDTGSGDASHEFGRGSPLFIRFVRPATAQELPPPAPKAQSGDDDDEAEN